MQDAAARLQGVGNLAGDGVDDLHQIAQPETYAQILELVGAAVSSSTTVGSNEVVRFINTQATARTVFVVVDTSTTTPGDYSLTIDLATPTQALSSIAASCDDLSAAVALLSSTTTPATSRA